MNEQDLIPFDWEAYKAGAEAYVLGCNGTPYIVRDNLTRTEDRDSDKSYFISEMRAGEGQVIYEFHELRLLKPKEEKHIGSTLDSFLEDEGILEECENAAKDSLIMR